MRSSPGRLSTRASSIKPRESSSRAVTPKYSRLTVRRKAHDETVLGILSIFGPLGFQEVGSDLVAYYRESEDTRTAGEALNAAGIAHEIVTDLPEPDPLEAYRAASRPFPIGNRFWIDPGPASETPPPPGRIALRVPASRAFGTGAHESTKLAILALEEEPLDGCRLLDVGTGSGILALAATALGARWAIGVDSDSQAVFVARENLLLHPFGARVLLTAASPAALSGSFSPVVANLLPEELLPMRAGVLGRVGPRGRLIVSGIPSDREGEVLPKLRGPRWSLAGCRRENGWTCVTLERG